MQTVLWILAANTLIACGLSMIALLASRLGRPALAHVIWLLVIAKLLTPPLWNVPIRVADSAKSPPASASTWHGRPAHEVTTMSVTADFMSGAPVPQFMPQSQPTPAPAPQKPIEWRVIVIAAASTGALIYLMFAIGRLVAFRRLLTLPREELPGFAKEVELLAAKIGLARPPRIVITAAPVSPMLMFHGGRPTFIAPRTLLQSLDADQRKAVIVHELAHLRRGDHWIRLFELLATALLWWHPLLWLARLGLHAAEEQCCDAWVVAILPDSRRRYADALVDATEWISRVRVPAIASGLGQVHNLRRRLTMIVDRTQPRSLSFVGRLFALALLAALPLSFVRADDPVPGAEGGAAAAPLAAQPAAVDDSTRKVIEALLETAQDPDQNVQGESMRAISRFGTNAVPVLVDALQGERTTPIVQNILASLGVEAIDPLIAALNSPNPRTRAEVLKALLTIFHQTVGGGGGGYGWAMGMEGEMAPAFGAAATPQSAELANRLAAPVAKAIEDEDVNVRRAALMLLGAIAQASPDDTIVKSLVARLKDGDLEVRRSAAEALAAAGPRSAAAVSALADALSDPDERLQSAALMALTNIGPDAKGATDAVLKVLKSPTPSIRSLAARALGAMQAQPQAPSANGAEGPALGPAGGMPGVHGVAVPGGFDPNSARPAPSRPPRPPDSRRNDGF